MIKMDCYMVGKRNSGEREDRIWNEYMKANLCVTPMQEKVQETVQDGMGCEWRQPLYKYHKCCKLQVQGGKMTKKDKVVRTDMLLC